MQNRERNGFHTLHHLFRNRLSLWTYLVFHLEITDDCHPRQLQRKDEEG